jgi:NAD(P)-dependent dehydrogenase (short-subunit alcohol dehydrogenase family)
MTRLQNKVAIITGGGSGIGRGLAVALVQEGAHAVICGRRQGKLEETLEIVRTQGGDALAVRADVSREADVQRLVKTTLDAHGRIDILINNAGIFTGSEIHTLEPGAWDAVMNTNLRAPYLTMRAVLPVMRSQRSGHIINISSESGLNYYKGDSAYGTSKHALNDLGEYVQNENQEYNIKVNTICPGMVVSEMSENEPGLNLEKCLYPDDIADLVLWLLSRRQNIKIGTPILIQTMLNPWE